MRKEKSDQILPHLELDLKNVGTSESAAENDVAKDEGVHAIKKIKPQIPRLFTENLQSFE